MTRDAVLLLRVLMAVGVILALPVSHSEWGDPYPGDGQRALGILIIFAFIGVMAAMLFFVLGSLAQFLLRKRPPKYTFFVDLGLFLVFALVLVYGGVTAKYQ